MCLGWLANLAHIFKNSHFLVSENIVFHFQLGPMKRVPNAIHRAAIQTALLETFRNRREWIESDGPTITDILAKYPHLTAYEGEMVRFFPFLSWTDFFLLLFMSGRLSY